MKLHQHIRIFNTIHIYYKSLLNTFLKQTYTTFPSPCPPFPLARCVLQDPGPRCQQAADVPLVQPVLGGCQGQPLGLDVRPAQECPSGMSECTYAGLTH